jgi:hypothetical protein
MLAENQNFSEQIQQPYNGRATFLEMAATILENEDINSLADDGCCCQES